MTRARKVSGLAALVGLIVAGAALLPLPVHAQAAKVMLKADRQQVAVGEPFHIEARVDIEEGDFENMRLPDLSDFEILGQSQRRPFSFSFGLGQGARSRSSVIHTFTVRALEPGKVRLPPVQAVVDGKVFSSQSLTLTITGSAAPSAGAAPPSSPGGAAAPPPGEADPRLFLRAVADTESVMVGEQVTVTFYLYSRSPLHSAPAVTREPTADGFWTHDLLPPSRTLSATTQRVDGRLYRVYVLQRFAAFPLQPGKLRIGPMEVKVGGGGSIFNLFQGRSEPLTRRSEPLHIEAEPLPNDVPPQALKHVGTLEASLTATPSSVRIGEAVTLKARLEGEGNLRAIRLPAPTLKGFEILQPKVDDQVTTASDRVGGRRSFEWLALAREPGTHEAMLPDIHVIDPADGSTQVARFAPVVLKVTQDQARAANAPPAATDPAAASRPPTGDGLVLGVPRSPATLRQATRPVHQRAWFWWTLILFPGFAGLYAAGHRVTRIRRRRGEGNGRHSLMRQSQACMESARRHRAAGEARQTWAAVQRALRLGLEARIGQAVGAWTYEDMQRRLDAAGLPSDVVRRVTDLLRESEAAQFTPDASEPSALAEALKRADALLNELRGPVQEAS